MKNKITLSEAIKIVEEYGGIVLLEEYDNTELQQRVYKDLEEIHEKEQKEQQRLAELQKSRRLAFEEFQEALGQENFVFETAANICYNHGLDLDDLEDMIHKYY